MAIHRLVRWGAVAAEFLLSQAGVLILSAMIGFMALRLLNKSEYALLAVAYSTIALFNTFTDMGAGAAMQSIGGRIAEQRQRFSQLVSTLNRIRFQLAVVASLLL